jgi:hypothetical protein
MAVERFQVSGGGSGSVTVTVTDHGAVWCRPSLVFGANDLLCLYSRDQQRQLYSIELRKGVGIGRFAS